MSYEKKFWILAITLTLVRVLMSGTFNLVPQEAYYWLYIQTPDFSYFDHPPACAYSIGLFTYLFGNKEIFVRLGMVLYSLGIMIVLFRLARHIFNDSRKAFFSVVLLNLTIFFNIESLIAKPDTPLLFFWIVTVYFLYSALFIKNSWRNWIFAGIFAGFALLSKYTGIFLFISAFVYLILSPLNRRMLLKPHPYIASVISVMVFSPVIYWNVMNNWASFLFQSSQRAHGMLRITYKYLFQLIGSQLYELTPYVFVLGILSIVFILKNVYTQRRERVLFLGSFSLPMIFFFSMISITSLVKMNWLEPSYLTLIIAIVFYLEEKSRKKRKDYVKYSAIQITSVFLIVFNIAMVLVPVVPIKKGDTWNGWKTLAGEVKEMYDRMSHDNEVFIFGNRYKISAELAFYTPFKDKIYAQNVYGEPALQFDYWKSPDSLAGNDAIFVYSDFEKMNYMKTLRTYFKKVEFVKEIKISYHQENSYLKKIYKDVVFRRFYIYRCQNYLPH